MGNFLAGFGRGTGAGLAAVVVVAVIAAAAWVQSGRIQTDDTLTQAALPQPDVPDARGEIAVKPETEAPASAPEPAALVAPAFDEVRREADGMTVIAGRAEPGAQISILLDGTEIAKSTADAAGKFAVLTMIAPDGQGHLLTLSQSVEQQEMASDDQIILAPIDAPVVATEAPQIEEDIKVAALPAETSEAQTDQSSQTQAAAQSQTEPANEPAAAGQTASADDDADATRDTAAVQTTPLTETAGADASSTEMASAVPLAETADAGTSATEIVGTAPLNNAAQAVADTADAAELPSPNAPSEDTTTQTVAAASAEQTPAAQTPAASPALEPVDALQKPDDAQIAAAVDGTKADDITTTDPAPQRVAVLKTTKEGVELLNPVSPEVMDNVAIDTISYSNSGAVQLAGRAQSQAQSVRVYLNNNSVVSLPVDTEGRWRGNLPDVDEGIYTLRVDEVTADGSVSSRVETPFKREDPAILAAASAAQEGPIKAVTVQKGATLWAIARDRYGSGELYVRVFDANRSSIRNPDLIYPGQIFDLPD